MGCFNKYSGGVEGQRSGEKKYLLGARSDCQDYFIKGPYSELLALCLESRSEVVAAGKAHKRH
jgi:hypothetical protein